MLTHSAAMAMAWQSCSVPYEYMGSVCCVYVENRMVGHAIPYDDDDCNTVRLMTPPFDSR